MLKCRGLENTLLGGGRAPEARTPPDPLRDGWPATSRSPAFLCMTSDAEQPKGRDPNQINGPAAEFFIIIVKGKEGTSKGGE